LFYLGIRIKFYLLHNFLYKYQYVTYLLKVYQEEQEELPKISNDLVVSAHFNSVDKDNLFAKVINEGAKPKHLYVYPVRLENEKKFLADIENKLLIPKFKSKGPDTLNEMLKSGKGYSYSRAKYLREFTQEREDNKCLSLGIMELYPEFKLTKALTKILDNYDKLCN
jgi:hypothetical protein